MAEMTVEEAKAHLAQEIACDEIRYGHRPIVSTFKTEAVTVVLAALEKATRPPLAVELGLMPTPPPPAPEAGPRESAWLVELENPSPPQWFCGGPESNFTTDANEAMRFVRQQDAERFISSWFTHEELAKATEHVWLDGPKAAPAPDRFDEVAEGVVTGWQLVWAAAPLGEGRRNLVSDFASALRTEVGKVEETVKACAESGASWADRAHIAEDRIASLESDLARQREDSQRWQRIAEKYRVDGDRQREIAEAATKRCDYVVAALRATLKDAGHGPDCRCLGCRVLKGASPPDPTALAAHIAEAVYARILEVRKGHREIISGAELVTTVEKALEGWKL